MAKIATSTLATHSGGRAAVSTMPPNTMPDKAMPTSTPGIGTPSTPRAPPKAITSGKITGSSHIAGVPKNAPQMPTATMAAMWSSPFKGWTRPLMKPPTAPVSECAWARQGTAKMQASTMGFRHTAKVWKR